VIFASIVLIVLGAILALMGMKIFKVVLPIFGFIAGLMVGFSGVQAIFGKGAVSLAIAIIVAVIVGVVMALLSFFFFNIAVAILVAIMFANMMIYLAIALGLSHDGFITLLMGFAGAILGLALAIMYPLSGSLVLVLTSFYGVLMIFGGIMLAAGHVSLDDLHNQGILFSVSDTVNYPFLWFLAWIGASFVAMRAQVAAIKSDFMDNKYAYTKISDIDK
jgi:hypothetical protein